MSAKKRPLYAQRLNRDLVDVMSHDFNCSTSCLSVAHDGEGLALNICIMEGPYHGGHFSFHVEVPQAYPFVAPNIWAKHPIWHPNIELTTGRVGLPLEWSPVLTLNSMALAVQMMLLEPSTDNALNTEASSSYQADANSLEQQVQMTLEGGQYRGVEFPRVAGISCAYCRSRMASCGSTLYEMNTADNRIDQQQSSFQSQWKLGPRRGGLSTAMGGTMSTGSSASSSSSSSSIPREMLRRKRSDDDDDNDDPTNADAECDDMQCSTENENENGSCNGSNNSNGYNGGNNYDSASTSSTRTNNSGTSTDNNNMIVGSFSSSTNHYQHHRSSLQLGDRNDYLQLGARNAGNSQEEKGSSTTMWSSSTPSFSSFSSSSSSKRMKLELHEEVAAAHMFDTLSLQKDFTTAAAATTGTTAVPVSIASSSGGGMIPGTMGNSYAAVPPVLVSGSSSFQSNSPFSAWRTTSSRF